LKSTDVYTSLPGTVENPCWEADGSQPCWNCGATTIIQRLSDSMHGLTCEVVCTECEELQ
jgi:hypothetical protein